MKANEIIRDKNGREMKTGDIVKIEGAFFKSDNGYYYIERTPGDPSWTGLDYSLKKIGKRGKISEAKYNLAFWPLWACTSDQMKNAEAREHNEKNATIEIISEIDNTEVIKHFREEAKKSREAGIEYGRRWGEDSEIAIKYSKIAEFYEEVASRIETPAEDPADIITAPELVASVVYDFRSIDEEETTEEAAAADQLTLDIFFNLPEETPAADPAPEEIREETPAEEEKAPETATEAPEEVTTAKYYDVSETTAERAWYCVHMGDYKKGSATAEYRSYVDEATQIAEAQKKRVSPFYHDRIDALLDRYSKKLATWFNDYNRNEASCPSWFISGPANYPVRKHERKMSRERSLWEEYHNIQAIKDKIKSIGTGPIDLSDPHAREMLEERIEKYQNELELDKRLNAYYRKHNTLIGCPDLSESAQRTMTAAIDETRERCPWITKPVPDYELTSLRDKIKRTTERIAELDRREAAKKSGESNSEQFNGGEIVRNIELDRLQIIFTEIPAPEVREKLKSNGFRWSPKNKAWQRQLTPNAERALKSLEL